MADLLGLSLPASYTREKSVDQLLSLLRILDCDVDLVVKERAA
jgi:hypothetical protein